MGMHFHVVLPFVFYVCFVAKILLFKPVALRLGSGRKPARAMLKELFFFNIASNSSLDGLHHELTVPSVSPKGQRLDASISERNSIRFMAATFPERGKDLPPGMR